MQTRSLRILLTLFLTITARTHSWAQVDPIASGLWYNEEKTARIKVYKSDDDRYYGKIVWLKVPEINGKPKTDQNNPDEAKRKDPILGLQILKGLKQDTENSYEGGTIYDPKSGRTYSCKATYEGSKLSLRGYIGFSLIGRTTTWTKVE
jgi:uncharacterized protein (DUF2147 family)